MSARKTPKWTSTLYEAYGERGEKGERGEQRVFKKLTRELSEDYQVERYPDDKVKQCNGIDIIVKSPNGVTTSIDVKNNLKTNKDVCIDVEKILRSKADMWIHVNDEDENDVVMYKTASMRRYIRENYKNNQSELIFISRKIIGNLDD